MEENNYPMGYEPAPVPMPEPEEEDEFEDELDTDIDDLFEVPDSVSKVDLKPYKEDTDFSDILTVTEDDVMGEDVDMGEDEETPRRVYRRTTRPYRPPSRYYPPNTSLGGMRG